MLNLLRWSCAAIAAGASIWALLVWTAGGFAGSIGAIRISSTDPSRALIVAAIAAAAYVLTSRSGQVHDDARRIKWIGRPARLAVALALAASASGLIRNSWTAGGADSYSYVTQADLWMERRLTIPAPIADVAPWPDAIATFSPLGYRPSPHGSGIVPVTGPGLPMLMALFKAIAGHCAALWVVPLTCGLLVWATFAIGRRLGSEGIGLGAAWLVATSPIVLMMSSAAMSDVPAAAFWTLATLFALGGSSAHAIAAGATAALAILIRPNLVPLAAILGAWMFFETGFRPGIRTNRRCLAFAAAVVPGCVLVAIINYILYGSPLTSGYGRIENIFSLQNVGTNLRRYSTWLIETQTPIAVLGLAALFVPTRRIWRSAAGTRGRALLAGLTVGVVTIYCVYTPFDAWWFLRFLLPCWPAICIGTSVAITRLSEPFTERPAILGGVLVLALGMYTLLIAARHDVFPANEGERRYATIAKLIEAATEPSSVIFTAQHAGPIRYYAGRLTVRFDLLHADWLDRAVEWLAARGRHAYILVEDWERPQFVARFAAANRLGRLELAPVLAFHAYGIPGTIYLFDPRRPDGPTSQPIATPDPRPRCVLPAPAVSLTVAPASD